EMEIAPLNPRQVEEFLRNHYGDDPAAARVRRTLRQNGRLRELARATFQLAVIVRLARGHEEISENPLELYREIVRQLVGQRDREKRVERDFLVKDPDGAIKLDFLKRLAFERLLVDEVGAGGEDGEAARLVFTGEVILDKAKRFVRGEGLAEVTPHHLASDVKATPLLREVGADAYAFAHLTIQEYLAASALAKPDDPAKREDCERIFCRAYFNPTLAEMETLPMALGLAGRPDTLYALLEHLPESLTFANLRLRARGLAYTSKVNQQRLAAMTDRLIEFIAGRNIEETPYRDAVVRSFSAAGGRSLEFIVDRVASLLHDGDDEVRRNAAHALRRLGSERAVAPLIAALK
ncbi:MAG: NACHT domain-containing protein, partial [Pyrinomonadaceae bacterium]